MLALSWFLYAWAAMLFMYALRRIPLSVAVPFAALTYVGAAATGHLLYSEPLWTFGIVPQLG